MFYHPHPHYRLLVNTVNEEGSLRQEIEEEVEELREFHTLESRGRALDYQSSLANWKIYEKARVNCMNSTYNNTPNLYMYYTSHYIVCATGKFS